MDGVIMFFSIAGLVYTVVIVVCILVFIWQIFKEYLLGVKHRYKQKHRFDKKPIAKCYCIDCEHSYRDYHEYLGCTHLKDQYVADNWFCWSAKPRNK